MLINSGGNLVMENVVFPAKLSTFYRISHNQPKRQQKASDEIFDH